ncbi:FKBP-type peptidyl-prolyl cis-trans isomerase [Trichlorobacter ammonificans]|uniref:Peptidyl-prolyl cis-trans isomerase n=1 Tax=Trichlorobacter ammonificans TaxID=2916410 RepID=A0ABM9D7I0_9BACT|nr:FKBP-type peptidyl-prolyl cis-trans isomerase [Trichlorobacter ammonificans]CAH2030445.1 Peptidyl-prolyl cis-trans isomerase [Trichlorobacter ammonificans]
MAQAQKGDRVRIHFTGTLEDGSIFETTREEAACCDDDDCCESGPMELVIGNEDFFPAVESALIGMAPGESVTVQIPAADAFGDYDAEAVFTVERHLLPDDLIPEVGMELTLTGDDDEELEVTVVEVSDSAVTFDANHPLAGEDLTYEVELVEIL